MTARHPSTHGEPPRAKTVLFCTACGHESHVAGDWVVRDDGDATVYECPVCGVAITRRASADPVAP